MPRASSSSRSGTVVDLETTSRPERIDETLRLATWDVPDDVWKTIEPLAAPQELWQW